MTSAHKYGHIESFLRLIRYRLVIPMIRAKHPPEYIARGVLVGMLWAMTPTIGIQMAMVALTWLITTRFFNWNFSLIVGVAWTWTTNVVTMVPIYYLFFITGQVLLGRYDNMSNFSEFQQLWAITLQSDLSFLDLLSNWFTTLFTGWGLPMAIGCIPWCLLSGYLSYHLSYNFVMNYRRKRTDRLSGNLA